MRRKKRLLFDVLDDMIEPRDRYDRPTRAAPRARKAEKKAGTKSEKKARRPAAAASRRREPAPSPRRSLGEGIRLSYGMAGAVLLVLLVVVGVAYRFGFDHGEGGVFSRETPEIPRRIEGPRDLERDHFAVRAANIDYRRGQFDDAAELAQDYVDFLLERGYVDAIGVAYPDEGRPGHGRIIVWAGQAERETELAKAAEHIRGLSFRGKSPFGTAYVQLFSAPK